MGLNIYQDNDNNFFLNQELYIKKILQELNMSGCKFGNYPLSPNYGQEYPFRLWTIKGIRNQSDLCFITVNTRLDISVNCPTSEDWNELKRTYSKMFERNSTHKILLI